MKRMMIAVCLVLALVMSMSVGALATEGDGTKVQITTDDEGNETIEVTDKNGNTIILEDVPENHEEGEAVLFEDESLIVEEAAMEEATTEEAAVEEVEDSEEEEPAQEAETVDSTEAEAKSNGGIMAAAVAVILAVCAVCAYIWRKRVK